MVTEKTSWWESGNPFRFVVSIFHASSWGGRLLDHCQAHVPCPSCDRANESNGGCVFPPTQAWWYALGAHLHNLMTLLEIQRIPVLAVASWFRPPHMCGSANPGISSLGSASKTTGPERDASNGATRHTSPISSLSRLAFRHRISSIFHHVHATSRPFQAAASLCEDRLPATLKQVTHS